MAEKTVDVSNSEIVQRSGYTEVLQTIIEEGHCPFCQEHLFKHHTKPLLIDGPRWLVTENFKPYAGTTHHFLLINKRHVERIEGLTRAEWAEFQEHFAALSKKYKLEAATLLWRSGETSMTGATVRHLHAQIIVGQKREADSVPITAVVGFKKENE